MKHLFHSLLMRQARFGGGAQARAEDVAWAWGKPARANLAFSAWTRCSGRYGAGYGLDGSRSSADAHQARGAGDRFRAAIKTRGRGGFTSRHAKAARSIGQPDPRRLRAVVTARAVFRRPGETVWLARARQSRRWSRLLVLLGFSVPIVVDGTLFRLVEELGADQPAL